MKMKKIVSAALISVLALSVIGCGAGNDPAPAGSAAESNVTTIEAANPWEATVKGDGSLDRVKAAGKITVGLDDAYPPMGYHDENTGDLIGFDIDMANLIGEKLGIEIEFVPADWNAIIPSLQTEKFDAIISGMNMWDTRIAEANYVPYGVAAQCIIAKADSPDIDKMGDVEFFKDKVIGTQLGATAAVYLQAAGFVEGENLTLYKTYPEITIDLDNGRIDALAIDTFSAVKLLETGNYAEVATLEGTEGPVANWIGIALRKEDGDLQLAIQKAVDELIVGGELKDISMKWIGMDITEELVADAQARLDANNY